MDRETLLLANAATVVGYAIAGHLLLKLAGRRSSYHIFQYIGPAVVVAVMLIFRFMQGGTTAQQAAGDGGAKSLWVLWWYLMQLFFLVGIPLAGVCQLTWGICSLFHKDRLLLALLALFGVGLHCLTFYTVVMYILSV